MMNAKMKCQIHGDRGKTLKFAEVAQICEFCESRNARAKSVALIIALSVYKKYAEMLSIGLSWRFSPKSSFGVYGG